MIYPPGATSISIDVGVYDDTGLPVTGLVAATLPAIYWTLSGNTASTSITLSDLVAITTAYSSGGVKERAGSAGIYRLDLPNAALTSAGDVRIYGEASGKHLVCEAITVGNIASNAVQMSGTALTARDIGASVLLSSGIGTGQIILASGLVSLTSSQSFNNIGQTNNIPANVIQWGGSAVTGMPMPTYTQPSGFLATVFGATVGTSTYAGGAVASVTAPVLLTPGTATGQIALSAGLVSLNGTQTFNNTGTWTGNLTGTVGSVTGAVGSITGISFPTGFSTLTASLIATTVRDVDNTSPAANSLGAAVNAAGGGGLSGPSTVSLTFVDALSNPVPLVEFSIAGQGIARANVSGVATFGLANGTFTVTAASTSGVIFPVSTLVVSGTTSETITGRSPSAIIPPVDPDISLVYGYTVRLDGTVAPGATVTFALTPSTVPEKTSGGSIIAAREVTVKSDYTGFVQANLILGFTYTVTAPTLKFQGKSFTPSTSTFNLATLV